MAVELRLPITWSPTWFQRFYTEVLARPLPVGALVLAESDPAPVYGYGEWQSLGNDTIGGVAVTLYKRIN